ncbi:hypothetical protein [Burkholderia multivorans]|uniref:hypothetical protein n=1 Tax=Burkholderia multivorans TaxID=87883 RepID=UPI001E4369F3|nr:hypothetical protein [Burkholderia multivorans]
MSAHAGKRARFVFTVLERTFLVRGERDAETGCDSFADPATRGEGKQAERESFRGMATSIHAVIDRRAS